MQFLIKSIVAVGISTMVATAAVSAHGDGASWEMPAGRYVVDVGYEPDTFIAGQSTRFDFALKEPGDTGDSVPFTEVWVRMKSADATYLAVGVRQQSIGPTTLLYAFGEPGRYSLEASFRDAAGSELAAATFPITVTGGEKTNTTGWPLYFGLLGTGVLLGTLGLSLFSRRK